MRCSRTRRWQSGGGECVVARRSRIEQLEKLRDGARRAGQNEARGEFVERFEDESAGGDPRVRNAEAGLIQDEPVVEQEIQVERAWPPPLLVGAVAAERAFDGELGG